SVSSSLLAATMNQKSSLREVPQFVSRVLTANSHLPQAIAGAAALSFRNVSPLSREQSGLQR
ncbi:hypothetical protein ABIA99_007403, partial [Bradyrhizobium sp. LB12.1]